MAVGFICPVCDYPKLSESPRSEFGGGSFEICPSCGFQFGVNDDDEGISYETWRRRWEAAGMPWKSAALKQPATWKPVAKHVAPGGAALRRPGESAAQAQTRDDAEETAATTPETKPIAKKTAVAAQKPEGKPAAKPAAKKAKTAKKSSGS
jgi:hypothetical protein